MSYLVLARKYRPQTFSEIVGQQHITRTLANAFAQDRVHHAFLFCGPRGVGKTTAARVLGKALNCARGPTAEPCGECSACHTIASGSSVDYHEMDGASNRGIDSIRDLTEAVRYQPAALRKKVYVIDEVHMLTTEAFNALLKTLEEPPPHVTFVLATTEPHKVPNTILSRCQRYDFKLVPASLLAEHVTSIFATEAFEIEPGAVRLIVRESGGSVRDALSLCDQVISYVGDQVVGETAVADVLGVADRALTRTLVTALAGKDARTALASVDDAVGRGVDEVQLARAIVRFLRDLAVAQVAPDVDSLFGGTDEERADLAALAEQIEPSRVRQMFDRLVRACEDLAESQQPRMILDLALVDVAAVEEIVPLGDLLERLGDLERKLLARGAGAGGGGQQASGVRLQASRVRAEPAARSPQPAARSPQPEARSPQPEARSPQPEARGPRPSPATSTDPLMRWENVIVGLDQARELTLASMYQAAKLLSWDEAGVVVGVSRDGVTAELATDPEKVAAMKAFLEKREGEPVEFTVRLLSDSELAGAAGAKSVIEAADERARDEREARQNEARKHPLTRQVLDTFGAEIKEIKTDV